MILVTSSTECQSRINELSVNRASANFRIIQSNCLRSRCANTCKQCLDCNQMDYIQVSQPELLNMKGEVKKPVPAIHLHDKLQLLIKCFFLSSFTWKHHSRSYGSTIDNRCSKIWCNFQTTTYHFFETNDLLCKHQAKPWKYSTSFTSKWCSRHCCETIEGLYSKISAYLLRSWISTLQLEHIASRSFLWW